jgi:hypothetical protein
MENQKPKRFSDLDGAKLKIDDVINREILIISCKVKESKYSKTNSTNCLTIQFVMDEKRYVIFTGSSILIEQMGKYKDEIPFLATIKKIDKYYTLS